MRQPRLPQRTTAGRGPTLAPGHEFLETIVADFNAATGLEAFQLRGGYSDLPEVSGVMQTKAYRGFTPVDKIFNFAFVLEQIENECEGKPYGPHVELYELDREGKRVPGYYVYITPRDEHGIPKPLWLLRKERQEEVPASSRRMTSPRKPMYASSGDDLPEEI